MDTVHRRYREGMGGGRFRSFPVTVGESDLWIGVNPEAAGPDLEALALDACLTARAAIRDAIARRPEFASALAPLPPVPGDAPVVVDMCRAGALAGTGPMAAVAGAVAREVGRRLLQAPGVTEVVVENGGDLFVRVTAPLACRVFAGASPLSDRVGVWVPAGVELGVCTSSGTVGPSLSLGLADAVMVACADAAVADAWATSLANRVRAPADVEPALALARGRPELLSCLVVIGQTLGACGGFDLFVVPDGG